MNNFFSNISRIQSSTITSATSHKKYINKQTTQNNMFMHAITKEELKKEIMKLNRHKATRPDYITAYIIKRNNTKVLQPLLHIINMTIEDGT